jgi:hypothetical protein
MNILSVKIDTPTYTPEQTIYNIGSINSLAQFAPMKKSLVEGKVVNSIVSNGDFANGITGWSAVAD